YFSFRHLVWSKTRRGSRSSVSMVILSVLGFPESTQVLPFILDVYWDVPSHTEDDADAELEAVLMIEPRSIHHGCFGIRDSVLRISAEIEIENAHDRFESVRNVALLVFFSI